MRLKNLKRKLAANKNSGIEIVLNVELETAMYEEIYSISWDQCINNTINNQIYEDTLFDI